MEIAPLAFLTFEDIVRDGACANGVLRACEQARFFSGTVQEVLKKFPDDTARIMSAAKLDGYGDGYGYGDGDGDGYGYGDGDGDGYGDGDGDGSGNGNG